MTLFKEVKLCVSLPAQVFALSDFPSLLSSLQHPATALTINPFFTICVSNSPNPADFPPHSHNPVAVQRAPGAEIPLCYSHDCAGNYATV